jgi:hypothetical protein
VLSDCSIGPDRLTGSSPLGPFMVARRSSRPTMWVPHPGLLNLSEGPHTYLLCFARILKGVFECFNELFSKHSGNTPYSYGKIYVQHPDIPHAIEVVQVEKFKYEVNFDRFGSSMEER